MSALMPSHGYHFDALFTKPEGSICDVGVGSDIQPNHQAASLGVPESADEEPESDVALSAFWGLDEDVLDLLA
jgi:hypothetical protein